MPLARQVGVRLPETIKLYHKMGHNIFRSYYITVFHLVKGHLSIAGQSHLKVEFKIISEYLQRCQLIKVVLNVKVVSKIKCEGHFKGQKVRFQGHLEATRGMTT